MGSGLKLDGLKVKSIRIQRGWPQEQLARIADVSPRTIQRLEAGGKATFETLRSIASAFEMEARDLLEETPKTEASLPAPGVAENGQAAASERDENDLAEAVGPDALGSTGRHGLRVAGAFSGLRAYVPFLRGLLGSAAIVFLIAAAIRLSPLILWHEPAQEAAESSALSGQGLAPALPATRAAAPVELPPAGGAMAKNRHRWQQDRTRQTDSGQTAETTPEARISSSRLAQEQPGYPDGQSGETKIDWSQEAKSASAAGENGFAELHRGTTFRLGGQLHVPSPTFEAPAGAGSGRPGLAGVVGQGAASGYNSLSKSLRQSGMNTASFFSRVGDSFKRAF